ncbi:MAG: FAD-binding oxidoreductase [Myxococcales bacterium]|nr:FAD-binding oxidoreductase [Myxococcales bacterium]
MADRRAVIMGAGITGVLVARELLLAGWEVTVLEAKHVGAGSSSRTAAGIRQQFSTPGTVRGMRYSVGFYQRFAEEVEDGTCPIVQNGYLFLHADQRRWEQAKQTAAMQRDAGLTEVEVLEHADLRARFPWVGPEAALGATHCPTDGFLLPHLVYNEGARRVRELGGALLQTAPVTEATLQADRVVAVKTPKGTFEGDLFVDCTNAWTHRLAAILDAQPLEVCPYKRYIWFLQRDGPMTAQQLSTMPLTITPQGTYVRPENEDTLMMGRKHVAEPELGFAYEDQDHIDTRFSHSGGVDAWPFELWMELSEVVPSVAEFAGIQATTGGYYAETPDHNPFLGYDRQRANLVRLVGFSGHGAMMGPFTAKIALSLCEAGADVDSVEVDGAAVSLDAFRIGRDLSKRERMVI